MLLGRPSTAAERGTYGRCVVAFATCPSCGKKEVPISNLKGLGGEASGNFLRPHTVEGKKYRCTASNKKVIDLPGEEVPNEEKKG